jgi:hypothetical protein
MTKLSITHEFIRKLTKEIRAVYGMEVRHTQILAIVAQSLGWKPDALMHMLKSRPKPAENSEPANRLAKIVDVRVDPPAVHFRDIGTRTAEPVTELGANASHKTMDANQMRAALNRALRRNPDVIIIDECKDPETIRLAREARDLGYEVWSPLQNKRSET